MVVKKVVVTKETTWKRDGNKKKKKEREEVNKKRGEVECSGLGVDTHANIGSPHSPRHTANGGFDHKGTKISAVHYLGVAGVCAEPQSAARSWRGILCMPYGVYGVYNTPSRGLMSLPDALRHAAWSHLAAILKPHLIRIKRQA
ncbi:predicted protein [Histoplasma capsulatum G186AR]|uniref:Uncharacterized protein n=1 Tax=Ajellomyces capsulatus (strain G186AR / H82 / ATCC MYA-2454 / RMSCC 2432) TaxID=447093 RepID=C0NN83_AJECG|nr:uncharacterized protein HCBG_04210 [Histoplasma capsulatum G186AR]EEH07331.1 predicted protein [Histoplasma capsulatum G186AR]